MSSSTDATSISSANEGRVLPSPPPKDAFLPTTPEELRARGWDAIDILLVGGDAYIDHPAFGLALIGRWLEAHGFRVGLIAQPDWRSPEDILRLGRPRLFAGVTAGALDSMLAHYTAFRKKRSDDAYTPGGRTGARPNRASIVYTHLLRQAFPDLLIILGGIEASLRRATHYDFWSNQLRRSILLDSKADLLIYGMGERAILEVAERLRPYDHPSRSLGRRLLTGIPGTVYLADSSSPPPGDGIVLPSHEEILDSPPRLVKASLQIEEQIHHGRHWAIQASGDRLLVFTPPPSLTTSELDSIYALPFTRRPHPSYADPIPAMAMIGGSITTHRGCAGGCSFCALALHQGRRIISRSRESILAEVKRLVAMPGWRGSLTDVGGPSANMWHATCRGDPRHCTRKSCLVGARGEICPFYQDGQEALCELLGTIAEIPGVRHLRVASAVRHDLALRSPIYLRTLVRRFVGGQLKLAPEHCVDHVLRLMRKPPFLLWEAFLERFEEESAQAGKEQYIVPYLMSAFPGCTEDDMKALAAWLRRRGWRPQQVQCFIPTPGTVASAMFYAGIDESGTPIPVARSDADRLRQHRILLGQRAR